MRQILVVIDMQTDFIDGALGTPEAQAVLPRVADLLRNWHGDRIYATRDTHGTDYLNTAEGRSLPVSHCIQGTPGWQLHPMLAPLLKEAVVIDKPSFGSLELAERLAAEEGPISIEMVGLCTDICVVSNALLIKAWLPKTPLAVNAACCAGVTPESHQAALTTMRMCQVDIYND
ncbi:MAG: cysteine hydrolase [Oscillospiraceae bacterium]|nr:cysteine hydrolase [Oscillospiraceae bacterium]